MTPQEYAKKLDEQILKISDAKFLLTSVSEVHARQVKRIFELGQNGDGGKIGKYNSTKPIYVSPSQSPKKFPLKGKTGETKFKNGKSHKTGYFDSYKAFRGAINRETSFVNLRLTEDLKFDFTNSLTLRGNEYVTGVRRNGGKVDGIVKKYGEKTFHLTEKEIKLYKESVKRKLFDTLNS